MTQNHASAGSNPARGTSTDNLEFPTITGGGTPPGDKPPPSNIRRLALQTIGLALWLPVTMYIFALLRGFTPFAAGGLITAVFDLLFLTLAGVPMVLAAHLAIRWGRRLKWYHVYRWIFGFVLLVMMLVTTLLVTGSGLFGPLGILVGGIVGSVPVWILPAVWNRLQWIYSRLRSFD